GLHPPGPQLPYLPGPGRDGSLVLPGREPVLRYDRGVGVVLDRRSDQPVEETAPGRRHTRVDHLSEQVVTHDHARDERAGLGLVERLRHRARRQAGDASERVWMEPGPRERKRLEQPCRLAAQVLQPALDDLLDHVGDAYLRVIDRHAVDVRMPAAGVAPQLA